MVNLIEITKSTRGVNSREIKYKAIGKWVERTVQRDTRPAFNADGTKKLDAEGNEVRLPLEKDKDGKNIYVDEIDLKFESDGVLTDLDDALKLAGDEQTLWDCFAEGWNQRQYEKEASKDELDEFLSTMSLNDEQKTVFKRTARQISRNYDLEITEAAEMVKTLMQKKLAKAAQAAA